MYPIKANDFSNEEKINLISDHFKEIMQILGLDLENDSLKKTPHRVGKMFVNEIFKGLSDNNKPKISTFSNSFKYDEMIIVKDIKLFSFCEHHFLPFIGTACVGYIPNGKVVGLSKISRIVDYFSRRPQIQERLTEEIYAELEKVLNTEDIMIIIKATHYCMIIRGVEDINAQTVTSKTSGKFRENDKTRNEFMSLLKS
ncbi:MAG: GTP cyclohydrolase I FolE [Candidatus Gracilibacteria bacterium]|nr:GTP cyclohydrolase I FolE [Candidatus Gracilibacteria bacterium]MDD3120114.1 GTP cyclohydrolase I FolE [Candidatus Gracilibacteria bacterium]MDD4530591.1 GTP cyclohydrolase I FolE [Candidatus Gracilibacteria bacterium]